MTIQPGECGVPKHDQHGSGSMCVMMVLTELMMSMTVAMGSMFALMVRLGVDGDCGDDKHDCGDDNHNHD